MSVIEFLLSTPFKSLLYICVGELSKFTNSALPQFHTLRLCVSDHLLDCGCSAGVRYNRITHGAIIGREAGVLCILISQAVRNIIVLVFVN